MELWWLVVASHSFVPPCCINIIWSITYLKLFPISTMGFVTNSQCCIWDGKKMHERLDSAAFVSFFSPSLFKNLTWTPSSLIFLIHSTSLSSPPPDLTLSKYNSNSSTSSKSPVGDLNCFSKNRWRWWSTTRRVNLVNLHLEPAMTKEMLLFDEAHSICKVTKSWVCNSYLMILAIHPFLCVDAHTNMYESIKGLSHTCIHTHTRTHTPIGSQYLDHLPPTTTTQGIKCLQWTNSHVIKLRNLSNT